MEQSIQFNIAAVSYADKFQINTVETNILKTLLYRILITLKDTSKDISKYIDVFKLNYLAYLVVVHPIRHDNKYNLD